MALGVDLAVRVAVVHCVERSPAAPRAPDGGAAGAVVDSAARVLLEPAALALQRDAGAGALWSRAAARARAALAIRAYRRATGEAGGAASRSIQA